MRLTRLCAALLVSVSLALTVAACAPKTVTTTQGKAAYTADQVVIRINEVQNAAIQAEATGAVSTATTRLIVQFAISADQTLKATPEGWQTTVATGWGAVKAQLPRPLPNNLAVPVAALDAVLAALVGGL